MDWPNLRDRGGVCPTVANPNLEKPGKRLIRGMAIPLGHPTHCENWFDDKLYQIKISEML